MVDIMDEHSCEECKGRNSCSFNLTDALWERSYKVYREGRDYWVRDDTKKEGA